MKTNKKKEQNLPVEGWQSKKSTESQKLQQKHRYQKAHNRGKRLDSKSNGTVCRAYCTISDLPALPGISKKWLIPNSQAGIHKPLISSISTKKPFSSRCSLALHAGHRARLTSGKLSSALHAWMLTCMSRDKQFFDSSCSPADFSEASGMGFAPWPAKLRWKSLSKAPSSCVFQHPPFIAELKVMLEQRMQLCFGKK